MSKLECIEIEPKQTPKHTIICLHGLGADGNDFLSLVEELKLPDILSVRFIFPSAPIIPVTINNQFKMRAWYDIYSIALDSKIDHEGIARSVTQLAELIKLEEDRGILPQNIILVGFSQGAVIALTAALSHPKLLGGVISLSGYLPAAQELAQKNVGLPIFIAHGSADPRVPAFLGRHAADTLTQAGHQVSWHSYPIAHTICHEEINDITAWIQSIWH